MAEKRQRQYGWRASQQDELEESRSRHEQFRMSMFYPTVPEATSVPPVPGGGSIDGSETDVSGSRLDAAIKAALAADSNRGNRTFNRVAITPEHSSTSSAFQQHDGGFAATAVVPPHYLHDATGGDPSVAYTAHPALLAAHNGSRDGSGGVGAYKTYQAPYRTPSGGIESVGSGSGGRAGSDSAQRHGTAPYGYGGNEVADRTGGGGGSANGYVGNGGEPSGSSWGHGSGGDDPDADWGPEVPGGSRRGFDLTGGGVSHPSRDLESSDSGGVHGMEAVPPSYMTANMVPIDAGGTANRDDGDAGGGVALTPTGYDEPLELPDGCHHISLAKFLEVMTGPGLRVRKHHRSGRGNSGLRVLRYSEEDDNLTWDSHKILGAAQHVLPMADVEKIDMEPGNRVILSCVGGKDSYAVFEAANDDAAAVLFVGLERLRERTAAAHAS